MLCLAFAGCVSKNISSGDKQESSVDSGLKLWESNCPRCHNIPNPASFSDAEWDVIGSHMRVRANLTKKETVKIVEFLKTIN